MLPNFCELITTSLDHQANMYMQFSKTLQQLEIAMLQKVRKFSGEDLEFLTWFHQFYHDMTQLNIFKDIGKILLSKFMIKSAKRRFHTIRNLENLSFDQLVAQIMLFNKVTSQAAMHREKLSNLKQLENETVSQFLFRIRRKVELAYENADRKFQGE
jgi:hypothetical protein